MPSLPKYKENTVAHLLIMTRLEKTLEEKVLRALKHCLPLASCLLPTRHKLISLFSRDCILADKP